MFQPIGGGTGAASDSNIIFSEIINNSGGTIGLTGGGQLISLQPNSLYYVSFSIRRTIVPGTIAVTAAQMTVRLNNTLRYITDISEQPGSTGSSAIAFTQQSGGLFQTAGGAPTLNVAATIALDANPTQLFYPGMYSYLSIIQIL
jgi:hypothetical protein